MKKRYIYTLLIGMLLWSLSPSVAQGAWPTTSEWIAIPGATTPVIYDPAGDVGGGGSTDLVGDTHAAAYTYNDGAYLYFRLRLNDTPVQGVNNLRPFGWGFLLDTDNNDAHYEWLVMIDGITDQIYLAQNTVPGCLGCPSDKAEYLPPAWPVNIDETPGTGNYVVSVADTTYSANADYFLDFRISYADFSFYSGLTESSLVRYFIGSSNSAQTIDKDLQASSLVGNMSQPVTIDGTTPTTGSIMFVANLAGTGDVTSAYPGNTLYVKVSDNDQNSSATQLDTVTVTLTTPGGDTETVTLTETGVNTGVFTGSILTNGSAVSTNNGALNLTPTETVTATYTDAIDAFKLSNQLRTDTLTAYPLADVGISKTVDNTTPGSGGTVIFTITATNYGPSMAYGITITDILPAGLTYVSDNGGGTYNSGTGVWEIATLANGASTSLQITVTVGAGPTITNTATITSTASYDGNTANDTASKTVAVGGTDFAITKSVNSATPASGAANFYTVTITNNGPNNGTNVVVTDLLPAGATYTSYVATQGSYVSGTGVWTVGSLNSGSSATLTINFTSGGATVTNTASFTSATQPDSNSTNNSASATYVVGGADLSLTKSVSNPSPLIGASITYTVTLTNLGSNNANTITITDLLPAGLTYVSNTVTQGAYVAGTGVWTVGTLNNGSSATLTITATVNTGTGGTTITNTASVTASSQADPVTSNNTASASLTVQSADVSLTKTVSSSGPLTGSSITYTVIATNNGPSNATNLVITDLLPAGLTYTSSTVTQGSYVSGTGVWTVGTINNGSSATLTITATVTAAAGTEITNVATKTSADQYDPMPTNNVARSKIYVGGADIQVTKTVNNAAPTTGGSITYTITAKNNGPNNVTGLTIYDEPPVGVTYASHTTSTGTYTTVGGSKFKWIIGALGNGTTATLTITVTVSAAGGSTVTNDAYVLAVDQGDYYLPNNSASVAIYVGAVNISMAKSITSTLPATIGDTVTYSVVASNVSSNNATNVVVTDILPSGLTYVSSSATSGSYNSGTGSWSGITINAGANQTLTINATINTGTGGTTITNTATFASATQTEVVAANNTASASLTVQSADIQVVKVASDLTPEEYSSQTYTITVTNNGPHTVTNLVVTDALPSTGAPDITYVSHVASQGTYTVGTGAWSIGTLTNGSSATLTITFTVDAGTAGNNITNTASRTSATQSDPISTNNSSSITITPIQVPQANILTLKTVSTYSDPINSTTNPKAIPGSYMDYLVTVNNSGPGTAHNVIMTDPIPTNTEFFAGNLGGGSPVIYTDTTAPNGLTGISSITYSNDNGATWTYSPPATFDPAVTNIRVTLGGTLNANKACTLRFRVRVK